ncbi:LINE-1 retrotransposable element ORF2 protein [Cucumis melo var. makuwa]|uniref:LINE-1 retrotransposable element ORF2 protein n=1 Tax=Cucumis melo var. makuwa TaxID=1194695 RepID=A0A5D3C384_CUCMM|nr:LINE-1 retrotransposable element ORF2 protein [Cucumis melo var. makuwa]
MFSEEEIHSTLTSFTNNKSPEPDGFTMEFYKATWHLIKGDICNIFKDFHDNCIINEAVNVTNIALIAKKDKCSAAADYRPISLTTSLYKLIAKVIAERLKETLPYTVSKNQMAFIKGLLDSLGDKIKGVRMNNNLNLTHLLFADDILLFPEDNEDSLNNLKYVIQLFQLALGLNVNLNKSTISSINVDVARTNQVASSWGVSTQFFPTSYLGVPLDGKPISKCFWDNIKEKVSKKLSNWKYSLLSKGEKITLINSTLSSLPTYQLSVFKASASIYKSIEKTWRNFLWNSSNETQKLHLVRWSMVTSPKLKGGLGINRIKDTNFALLNKWLWRFIHEDYPLWKRFIAVKYESSVQGDIPYKSNYSSSRSPWHSMIQGLDWFQSQVTWKIKNDNNFSFWHSHWHTNSPLSVHYPRLFALSTKQNSSISDMWNSKELDWDFSLGRPMRDWEVTVGFYVLNS